MTALLLASLALAWLTVAVVFLAACVASARADRLARSAGSPRRAPSGALRLIEREILRG